MELSNVWHSEDSTEPERKPMLEVGILKNGVSVRVSVSVLVSSKLFGFCFGFDRNQKKGFGRSLMDSLECSILTKSERKKPKIEF